MKIKEFSCYKCKHKIERNIPLNSLCNRSYCQKYGGERVKNYYNVYDHIFHKPVKKCPKYKKFKEYFKWDLVREKLKNI